MMNELLSPSQEDNSVMTSGLLNKTLNLFRTDSPFNENTGAFLKWISNTYYPHLSLFIPNVSPGIKAVSYTHLRAHET